MSNIAISGYWIKVSFSYTYIPAIFCMFWWWLLSWNLINLNLIYEFEQQETGACDDLQVDRLTYSMIIRV